NQKDKAGQRLMLMMAKPRRLRQGEDPEKGPYWFDDQDRLQRLYEYNRTDVEVEREYYTQLQQLIAQELQIWRLDCIINARGFHLNRTLAESARKIAQDLGPELNAELKELTSGVVTTIHQVARLKAWLAAQSCPIDSLDKSTITELLASKEL